MELVPVYEKQYIDMLGTSAMSVEPVCDVAYLTVAVVC